MLCFLRVKITINVYSLTILTRLTDARRRRQSFRAREFGERKYKRYEPQKRESPARGADRTHAKMEGERDVETCVETSKTRMVIRRGSSAPGRGHGQSGTSYNYSAYLHTIIVYTFIFKTCGKQYRSGCCSYVNTTCVAGSAPDERMVRCRAVCEPAIISCTNNGVVVRLLSGTRPQNRRPRPTQRYRG